MSGFVKSNAFWPEFSFVDINISTLAFLLFLFAWYIFVHSIFTLLLYFHFVFLLPCIVWVYVMFFPVRRLILLLLCSLIFYFLHILWWELGFWASSVWDWSLFIFSFVDCPSVWVYKIYPILQLMAFGLFLVLLLCTNCYEHSGTSLCVHTRPSSGCLPESGVAGHKVCKTVPDCFPKWLRQYTLPLVWWGVPVVPHLGRHSTDCLIFY